MLMSHDLLLNMKIVLAIHFKMPTIVTTRTIVGILKIYDQANAIVCYYVRAKFVCVLIFLKITNSCSSEMSMKKV